VSMHAFASRGDALKFAGVTAKFTIVLTSPGGQEPPPTGFAAVLPDEIKWQPEAGLPGVQVAILLREKFEAEKLRTFPAGSICRLPAGVPHFQATRGGGSSYPN